MRLHRFYSEQSLPVAGVFSYTNENQIHQWSRVFRYKSGDRVLLFDGTDKDVECVIESLEKQSATLSVNSITESPAGKREKEVTLYFSLLKGSMSDFVLEKAVEMGVSHIVPLVTTHSEKREINMERARKTIVEACEQSGWGSVPSISEPIDSKDIPLGSGTVVFDQSGEKNSHGFGEVKNIVIGPEGGWSSDEREYFEKQQARIVSLNSATLRAETAILVALARTLSL
ncbi:MAG: RsmE family RNA methyltransferase [Candidatus Paceibacterota bacterium]